MISAHMIDTDTYEVVVEGESETSHTVHMSSAYYRELCTSTITHEYVLIQSFKFLLEREPNTSILPSFDLQDINKYFPEFESEMKTRFQNHGR